MSRGQWRIKVENKGEINRNYNKGDADVNDNDMRAMINNDKYNYYHEYYAIIITITNP